MKVEIEIDELAGCRIIDDDGNTKDWGDLTRQQQIRILNSFANFMEIEEVADYKVKRTLERIDKNIEL